ncbi:MAG TPA: signal peptidase II [Longimicrobium sp.]|nr:signal peptidase II [Longimicrobium sp.]
MKQLADKFIGAVTGERRRTRRGGRRRTDHEPNRGWIPILAWAVPIALFDWATKWAVVQTIRLEELRVISDRVALWHVKNPALVLGLHGDLPIVVRKVMVSIYATIAVLLLIAVLTRGHRLLPHRRKWAWLFLGMVAGGMLGNLGERVLHWGVTDFLSFRWGDIWLPPGNIADLSIILAMPVAMFVLLFELEARALRRVTAQENAAAELAAARRGIGSVEA